MRKVILVFLFVAVFASMNSLSAERHDSAVFLIDVSQTVCSKDLLSTAKKISQDMNKRFPSYVKSAGVIVFGNPLSPQVEWVKSVSDYDREDLDQALGSIKEGNGSTPMGAGIFKSDEGLEKAQGKKALIIISDGLDNGGSNPVQRVKALKEKYGSNLCVFTIQLGNSKVGGKLLDELVNAGECGKASKASELQSDDQVQDLVDFIFPAEARVKAKPRIGDADGDGVLDNMDKCPKTPKGVEVDTAGCWVIKDIRFNTAKYNILPQYAEELDKVVEVLKNNPDVKILIEGHTDSVGTDESNMVLSKNRAQSVLNYLVSKGIEKNRLVIKYYGESKPIESNDTVEGRAANRRAHLSEI